MNAAWKGICIGRLDGLMKIFSACNAEVPCYVAYLSIVSFSSFFRFGAIVR